MGTRLPGDSCAQTHTHTHTHTHTRTHICFLEPEPAHTYTDTYLCGRWLFWAALPRGGAGSVRPQGPASKAVLPNFLPRRRPSGRRSFFPGVGFPTVGASLFRVGGSAGASGCPAGSCRSGAHRVALDRREDGPRPRDRTKGVACRCAVTAHGSLSCRTRAPHSHPLVNPAACLD